MKHVNKFIFCLLGIVVVTACSKEEKIDSSFTENVSIYGSLESFSPLSSSRTQVGDIVGTDGALQMEWSVGDQVGVYGEQTHNARFVSNNPKIRNYHPIHD